jgi:hypothetical protein
METSIVSRMYSVYSEVTFHCSGVWQRAVQFYLWCMSRAGELLLSFLLLVGHLIIVNRALLSELLNCKIREWPIGR